MPAGTRRIIVVGGGLAGLGAAWQLARSGCRVTLLERKAAVGGRIATRRVEGFALEPIPAVLSQGDRRLLAWISEVGLRDELLPLKPVITAFASDGVVRDVELRSLGDVKQIPGVGRLQALRLARLPRLLARYGRATNFGETEGALQYDDRSLAAFGQLYFGRSVTDHWMGPALASYSLADPAETSRVQFLQHYACHRSPRFGLLRGTLGEALERAAESVEAITECEVARLEPWSDGGIRAEASDGRHFVGDAVVVATPAPIAAVISHPLLSSPERSILRAVRYAPSLGVAAALCRPLAPRARHLSVSTSSDSPLALALVEPGFRGGRVPTGRGLATLRATSAFAAAHLETPSDSLEKELVTAFEELWPGGSRAVEFTRVFRHRYGAPRFEVGHYRALARFQRVSADRRALGRRLYFAGDYRVHPSWEGALRSGERAASELLADVT